MQLLDIEGVIVILIQTDTAEILPPFSLLFWNI